MKTCEIPVPITRAWKSDDGSILFEGVTSSTRLDTQNEVFTGKAIGEMAAQPGVDLFAEGDHKRLPAGEEIGITTSHSIGVNANGRQVVAVAGKLFDDNPRAVQLYNRMAEGHPYELSVGVRIKDAFWAPSAEAGGKTIRHLDSVDFDHILVCRPGHAANPDTWLQAVGKALDEEWPEPATEPVEGKAGARHSAADMANFHAAIDSIKSGCGCGKCSGSGNEADKSDDEPASTSFGENLQDDIQERAVNQAIGNALGWALWDALEDTIRAIMLAGGENVLALVNQALTDFSAEVQRRLFSPSVPDDGAAVVGFTNESAAPVAAKEGTTMSDQVPPAEGNDVPPVAEKDETDPVLAAIQGLNSRFDGFEQRIADLEAGKASSEATDAPAVEPPPAAVGEPAGDPPAPNADTAAKLALTEEALKTAQDQIEALKAQPAAGGPVNGQASDEANKLADPEDDKGDIAEKAIQAGDLDLARSITTARVLGIIPPATEDGG